MWRLRQIQLCFLIYHCNILYSTYWGGGGIVYWRFCSMYGFFTLYSYPKYIHLYPPPPTLAAAFMPIQLLTVCDSNPARAGKDIAKVIEAIQTWPRADLGGKGVLTEFSIFLKTNDILSVFLVPEWFTGFFFSMTQSMNCEVMLLLNKVVPPLFFFFFFFFFFFCSESLLFETRRKLFAQRGKWLAEII